MNVQTFKRKLQYLLKDGFFHILFGNTLNKMIAFISSIVIVRLVSKSDYAYLSYADNLYSYINLFAGLGVSTAILKFCSPQKTKGENVSYLKYSLNVGVIFQFVLSIALVIGAYIMPITFPSARALILMMVLYPSLVQIETTIQSYIRAMLENKLYAQMGIVQTIVAFVSSVLLVLLIGIKGIVVARYVAILAAITLTLRFLKQYFWNERTRIKIETTEKRFFWKLSLSLMMANVFSMIMPINEMFLINNLIKDEVITANYKVAILIPSQLVFIANSIIIYVFPKIAQMGEDKSATLKYSIKIGSVLFGIITGVCAIGIVTTPWIIQIIYGSEYKDAATLSMLYWIMYGINAGFRLLPMNILPALGITFFNSILSIISCGVHFALLLVFIKNMGIYGAAYALILVYLLSGLLYWTYLFVYCRKERK